MQKVWLSLLTLSIILASFGITWADEPTQTEMSLPDLYEFVSPSVVLIEVVGNNSNDIFPTGGLGSGFVYDSAGHIVTNFHVVEDAQQISITFFDGTLARAEVVGVDADSDLAVIQVQGVDPNQLKPALLGDSSQLRVGETVVAIGNPFGQTWTMTQGIISALGRSNRAETGFSIPMMIQTDAAINSGNSGGPLVNLRGEVIGINNLIFTETGVSSGVGFAVPVNTVKRVIPELIANGSYEYTWIGISGGDLNLDLIELLELAPETRGVLIERVIANSPADQVGIRGSTATERINGFTYDIGGDILTAINGQPVTGITDLIAYLAENTRPGDVVEVVILRDGQELTLSVTLQARPNRAQ